MPGASLIEQESLGRCCRSGPINFGPMFFHLTESRPVVDKSHGRVASWELLAEIHGGTDQVAGQCQVLGNYDTWRSPDLQYYTARSPYALVCDLCRFN